MDVAPGAARRIAALMFFVAATLVVVSVAHLSGHVHGRSAPFDPEDAGVAEAIIAAVLATGAATVLRASARARTVGIATTGCAIVGFLVGLRFTTQGGHAPDIAYHVTVLPVLIVILVALLRADRRLSPAAATD